ncbi:MAG: hypothetical protein FWG35_02400, partial [Spirochaetaceae bacterium]|nr:hypothetical protein [Spirochaetaceae bacterium]
MKNKVFLYICVMAFFAAGRPLFSQDFEFQSLGVFHDTLWLENSDRDSAPSPILSVWGFSVRLGLTEEWSVAPEIAFSSVEYLYRDGIAYPAEIEYPDAVRTLTILFSLPFAYRYAPAEDMTFHWGTGPAFSFKVPYRTYGNAAAGDVAGYFMQKARFFHWEAAASFEWNFFESL